MTGRYLPLALVSSVTWGVSAEAKDQCGEDAMIVFDGSGSMSEVGFNDMVEPRIFEARRAVRKAIPTIATGRRLGLIIYGPGGEDSCQNIDLRFTPRTNSAERIIADVEALSPSGDTPLTASVARAAGVLHRAGTGGTVVLVTDGKETCGGDPCQLAERLAAEDPQLTVHVIGFKVRSRFFAWSHRGWNGGQTVARCLADRTGGEYIAAETVEELTRAFDRTLGCQLIAQSPRRKLTSRGYRPTELVP